MQLMLEHETTINGDPAIIDIFAVVVFDVDAWVVDFLGVAPSLTQTEQDGLKERFIAKAKEIVEKHNREHAVEQGLQARD